jgi:hypothetical protein
MTTIRRWWCEKRRHPKADVVVDERGFAVTWCASCGTIKFQALLGEVFAGDDLVGYYEELLADYGFGPA